MRHLLPKQRMTLHVSERPLHQMPDTTATSTLQIDETMPSQSAEAVSWAQAAHQTGNWGQASARWAAVREVFPNIFDGWRRGAEVLVEQGKPDDATTLLESAPAIFAEDANRLHDLARLAERRQDWVMMEHWWRRFLFSHPKPFWAHCFLAKALHEQGRHAEADHVLETAQQTRPEEAELFVEHARLAQRRNDLPTALSRWQLVVERYPSHPNGHATTATILRELGRWDEAAAALEAASRQFPSQPGLLYDLARLAEQRQDWAGAARWWRASLAIEPTPIWAHTGLAKALARQALLIEAEAALVAAQSRFPDEFEAFAEHARLAQSAGNWSEAAHRWRIVREHFPANLAGYSNEAAASRELGQIDHARHILEQSIARFPNETGPLHDLARHAEREGDFAVAERCWRRFIELDPRPWWAHTSLSAALQHQGQAEAAAEVLNAARNLLPNEPALAGAHARLAEIERNWAEAARRWGEMRLRFPNLLDGYLQEAKALLEAFDDDAAEARILEAQSRFPDHLHPRQLHAEFADRRGKWPEAIARWRVVRERFPELTMGWVQGARSAFRGAFYDDAEALIAEARNRFPKDQEIAATWAEFPSFRRTWQHAARRWRQVRSEMPHFIRAYTEEARMLNEAEEKSDAEAVLGEARTRFPQDPTAAFAWLRLSSEMLPAASVRDRWNSIAESFAHLPECHLIGADAFQRTGQNEAADAVLQKAQQRFPTHPDIARRWAESGGLVTDLDAAADRFLSLLPAFGKERNFVVGALAAFALADRHDSFTSLMAAASQRWPNDTYTLRIDIDYRLRRGHADELFEVWPLVAANTHLEMVFRITTAAAIYRDFPLDPRAGAVLAFLSSEPDDGTPAWRPAIAACFAERPPQAQIDAVLAFLGATDPASLSPLCRTILKTVAGLPIAAGEMAEALVASAGSGRERLTMATFRTAYFRNSGHPERLEILRDVLLSHWSKRLAATSTYDARLHQELLACLMLAFAFDGATFHRMLRLLRDVPGGTFLREPTAMQTRRDVLANMVSKLTALESLPSPAVHTTQRLRIAVCVSGQMRGYRESVPTWKHMKLDEHETQVFVHTWRNIGLNWRRTLGVDMGNPVFQKTIFSLSGRDITKARYPTLFAKALELEARAKDVDRADLKALFGTEHVEIEDDAAPPYLGHSNLWKMYYKIERAYEMAEKLGGPFDVVIRIRPDQELRASKDLDWHAIRAESARDNVVFTEFGTVFDVKGPSPVVGDKIYAGTQSVMGIACRAYSFARRVTDESVDLDMPAGYHPHTTLTYTGFYNGLVVKTVPNLVSGLLVNAGSLPPDISLAALSQDIGSRACDELDLALIADFERQLSERRRG